MKIAVIVFADVFDTGLASLLDTFAVANLLASTNGERPPFVVRRSGPRSKIRTGHGLRLDLEPLAVCADVDAVLLPGLGPATGPALLAMLARPDIVRTLPFLRKLHARDVTLAAACTSSFVLADAGLLDGHPATTTWWLSALLRERHPRVTVDESRMVVEADGGRLLTAGAALAHVDLALSLVRKESPTLAQKTACHLLGEERPSQAAYILADHIAHADDVVTRFEAYARAHLRTFSMPAAARSVGASERTLERHVRHVLGRSPVSFVRDLRVAHAVHRLETTRETIDEVAASVGYGDGATLRRLLRRKTGQGLRSLRGPGGRRTAEP